MNAIKQIFLMLSLFAGIMPIHAMEQGDAGNQGFFGKMWNLAKEHPVVAGIGVAAGLIGAYAFKNHLQDKRNQPLLEAATNGDIAGVKDALAKGAHINAKTKWYLDQKTALHLAAARGHLEVVKYLVTRGADINVKDNNGLTVLHYASCFGHLEIVNYLATSGADINAKDNNGWTVLHYASCHGRLAIVKYLVTSGADVNAKDNYGYTVLRVSHLEIVKYLLDQGVVIDGEFDNALARQNLDEVLDMIQRCHFIIPNAHKKESQKRLEATMILSKEVGLPKNMAKKIVSYMPEDLVSPNHAKVVFNYNTDIKELVAHCPISSFAKIYNDTYDSDKPAFLAKVVPAIVEYRLGKVKEMLEGKTSQDPVIASIIDIDSVNQHRAAITKHVTNGILGIEEEPEITQE